MFLFSHPGDFTPVCTTEIGRTAQLADEFAKRHVKPLGLSTDGVKEHLDWIKDVNDTQNTTVKFPIVADPDCKVARLYEMIHANESETAAVRSVFIIDPKKDPSHDDLPDERGPQLRRKHVRDRRIADGGSQPHRHARRLGARWQGHHSEFDQRRRGEDVVCEGLDGGAALFADHDALSGIGPVGNRIHRPTEG